MVDSMGRQQRGASYALVLLRVWTGLWFLKAGVMKLNAAYFNTGLVESLNQFVSSGALPFYKPFLTGIAIPNAKVFAALTAGGEVLVGITLILGFLTPLAAIGVLIMSVNYLFATWYFGPATLAVNATFLVLSLAFLIGGAGRTLGLDAKFL